MSRVSGQLFTFTEISLTLIISVFSWLNWWKWISAQTRLDESDHLPTAPAQDDEVFVRATDAKWGFAKMLHSFSKVRVYLYLRAAFWLAVVSEWFWQAGHLLHTLLMHLLIGSDQDDTGWTQIHFRRDSDTWQVSTLTHDWQVTVDIDGQHVTFSRLTLAAPPTSKCSTMFTNYLLTAKTICCC